MNVNFEGKRILVTGAGQGIGRDLALRLSKYGAHVVGISRTKKHLDSLKTIDPSITAITVDLSDWSTARKAVASVLPIDMVVNNAGVVRLAPFLEASEDDFDVVMNVNVKAMFNVSQVVAGDLMRRKVGGSIVNISSQMNRSAEKCGATFTEILNSVELDGTYNFSESVKLNENMSELNFFRAMAVELGPHNIRVNSVNPTVVMTAMGKLGWGNPEKARTMLDKIPLGRFAEVDEVVDAIVFLLSGRSSMINGVTLPIDGGFLAS